MRQVTLAEARRQRDAGIARAEGAQEAREPGWKEVALAFIVKYAMKKPPEEHFTGEDLVDAYRRLEDTMVQPDKDQSWGGVIQTAQRRNFIGKVPNKVGKRRKGHCSPCPVFYSRIFGRRWTDISEAL